MPDSPFILMTADELERAIEYHDYQYWELQQPVVSDDEYDLLTRRLEQLRPDSAVLGRVGGGFATTQFRNKVSHAAPMLSLDKCYNEQKYTMWLKMVGRTIRNLASEGEFQAGKPAFHEFAAIANDDDLLALAGTLKVSVSPKIDGVAASLRYNAQGRLELAATRGDGIQGEDFTMNARLISGIPWQIGTGPLEVRGEVYMARSVFTDKYGDTFPNPRNLTAGTLKQKESNRSQLLDLSFFAYDLLMTGPAIEHDKHDLLRRYGFSPVETQYVTAAAAPDLFEQALKQRRNWDFDADGQVVRLVDIKLQRKLGATAHHPRWAIAFKFQGDVGLTALQEVEWSVSRNAIITPVAIVQPVFLSGARVTRSTLHNIQEFRKLNLHRNDQLQLKRRGDVIPKVEDNLGGGDEPFAIPRECPSCTSQTVLAAPQLFIGGQRLARFADEEQLSALLVQQRRTGARIGLLSWQETHNSVARRTGDQRFRTHLTWGRKNPEGRTRVTRLLNSLPTLRPSHPEAVAIMVMEPARQDCLELINTVVPMLTRQRTALKLILIPHSQGGEPKPSSPYDNLVIAGREERFWKAAETIFPVLTEAVASSLRRDNGSWGEDLPELQTDLAYNLAEDVLLCSQPDNCPQVLHSRLEHFIQTLGVDGFGRKIIENLVSSGQLSSFADFFSLEPELLTSLDRLGATLAGKLVANVQARRAVPLGVFLQALGIDDLARHVSSILEAEYGDLDSVLALTEEDLCKHDSIAFNTAHQVVHGLRRSRPQIDRLREYVSIKQVEETTASAGPTPFAGQSFVFTGKLSSMPRKKAQSMAAELGGTTPDGITRELTWLVVGDEGSPLFGEGTRGGKLKKADKYNAGGATIGIISETRFLEMVEAVREDL
jgi:NAD-dependent DNA ligase